MSHACVKLIKKLLVVLAKSSQASHDTVVHSRLAQRHGHAERLQAVEGLRWRNTRRLGAGGNSVERPSNVCVLRAGRGLFKRSKLILAGKVLILFAGKVKRAVDAITSVMRPFVPVKGELSVLATQRKGSH